MGKDTFDLQKLIKEGRVKQGGKKIKSQLELIGDNNKPRKGKFNASPKTYNGRKFASTKEAKYAATLDLLLRIGEIKSWDYEPKFILNAYGKRITSHKIDFRVTHVDDRVEYIEIKGGKATKTDAWSIRHRFLKAYLAKHEPDATIRIIE